MLLRSARDPAVALGHAHFQLATQLEIDGHHDAAVPHFREAHRLVPASWTFRRQAWSLEKAAAAGPLARFWQGPIRMRRRPGPMPVTGSAMCAESALRITASPGGPDRPSRWMPRGAGSQPARAGPG